jgi:hypothetical protein
MASITLTRAQGGRPIAIDAARILGTSPGDAATTLHIAGEDGAEAARLRVAESEGRIERLIAEARGGDRRGAAAQ